MAEYLGVTIDSICKNQGLRARFFQKAIIEKGGKLNENYLMEGTLPLATPKWCLGGGEGFPPILCWDPLGSSVPGG